MPLLPEAGLYLRMISAFYGKGRVGGVANEISAESSLTMCLTAGLGMRMMTIAYALTSYSSYKAKVQMVKRLIFSYYSIPAIASYVDTTLFDAQVDGTKVSPCSMLVEGCACYSVS